MVDSKIQTLWPHKLSHHIPRNGFRLNLKSRQKVSKEVLYNLRSSLPAQAKEIQNQYKTIQLALSTTTRGSSILDSSHREFSGYIPYPTPGLYVEEYYNRHLKTGQMRTPLAAIPGLQEIKAIAEEAKQWIKEDVVHLNKLPKLHPVKRAYDLFDKISFDADLLIKHANEATARQMPLESYLKHLENLPVTKDMLSCIDRVANLGSVLAKAV